MNSIINTLFSIAGAIISDWPALAIGVIAGLVISIFSKFFNSYNGLALATLLVILSPFVGVDAYLVRSMDLSLPFNPFFIGLTVTIWVRFVIVYIVRGNNVYEKPKAV